MLLIKGHRSQIRDLAIAPNGKTLASVAGRGYTVSLWNLSDGTKICHLGGGEGSPVLSLSYDPESAHVMAGTQWGRAWEWNLRTRIARRIDRTQNSWGPALRLLRMTPDGERYIAASDSYWSYGFHVRVWSREGTGAGDSFTCSDGYKPHVIACSPTHQVIAVCSHRLRPSIWSLVSKSKLCEIHSISQVHDLAFSPDGQILALASKNDIHLWSTESYETVATLEGHQATVHSLAFSPEGEYLLSGSEDHTVRMWDLDVREEMRALDWDIGPISKVVVAKDGMRAAAGGDKAMMIWDLED